MSFNLFADSVSKKFAELSNTVQQKAQEAQLDKKFKDLSLTVSQKTQDLTLNLPSLAQTTQRRVQERLGQVTDISQMPDSYVQLEAKVDQTKLIYENFLKVTQIYESESYDYPQHISESVNDISKTITSKVQDLTKATSTGEAQSILISPGPAREPKTLNYALSKVALTSSEYLRKTGSNDTVLADSLLKYSDIQAKIAEARLQQDVLIQTRFNRILKEKLNEDFATAAKARKNVENKRLQYDISRANYSNAKPEKQSAIRVQMETLEEQFAQATEEAVAIMQTVLDRADFLKEFSDVVTAQLAYHSLATKLLTEYVNALDVDPAVHVSSLDYN